MLEGFERNEVGYAVVLVEYLLEPIDRATRSDDPEVRRQALLGVSDHPFDFEIDVRNRPDGVIEDELLGRDAEVGDNAHAPSSSGPGYRLVGNGTDVSSGWLVACPTGRSEAIDPQTVPARNSRLSPASWLPVRSSERDMPTVRDRRSAVHWSGRRSSYRAMSFIDRGIGYDRVRSGRFVLCESLRNTASDIPLTDHGSNGPSVADLGLGRTSGLPRERQTRFHGWGIGR